MTKFDLQKAKLGAPVCTRDGNEVLRLTFLDEGDHPILAVVQFKDEYGVYKYGNRYTNDGVYIKGVETGYDLMMK